MSELQARWAAISYRMMPPGSSPKPGSDAALADAIIADLRHLIATNDPALSDLLEEHQDNRMGDR